MSDATLTAIHIHPVKSCRAIELESVEVTETGLAGDRLFQVVDADGTAVTQRQQPTLATVRPTPIEGGLRLEAPGLEPLEIARPTSNDMTATTVIGIPVEAADAGDAAAAWFGELLGAPSRLVAMTDTPQRIPLPGVEIVTSWADAAPVLVTNTASLGWLAARASEPFGMDRFRPNLTVDAGEPWIEDTWRELTIGGARLGLGLAWPRCAIPQVDQQSGERTREPAKVLRAHRWCTEAPSVDPALRPLLEGNALFGIACSIGPVGTRVAIGDVVEVTTTDDAIIAPPS